MRCAYPRSVTTIHARGQKFLVGPAACFPLKVPRLGQLDHVLRRTAGDPGLRAQVRASDVGFLHGSGEDANLAWLMQRSRRREVLVIPLPNYAHYEDQEVKYAKASTGNLVLGGAASLVAAATIHVNSLSAFSRIYEVMLRSIEFLPVEVRASLLRTVSPEAFQLAAWVFACWADPTLMGVGEAADVTLVGVGYVRIGLSALGSVATLLTGVEQAVEASAPDELETAAKTFAQGLDLLGVASLLAFVARARVSKMVTAAEPDMAAMARWRIYIDGLTLFFDRSKGALWSRLGQNGARTAESLARIDGRLTLEMVLRETDFFDRYLLEFGEVQNNVTHAVWQMISEKYAALLLGQVFVYTDHLALMGASETQLSAELMEVIERGPVTGVVIKDVKNPNFSHTLTRDQMMKGSDPATPAGKN